MGSDKVIYGIENEAGLVVAAADTIEEFEAFGSTHLHAKGHIVQRPDALEMAMDDLYGRLALPPFVYAVTGAARTAFVAEAGIALVHLNRIVDLHDGMIDEARRRVAEENPDTRTIAEIHGLDEHDPWDTRTEAQKQKDELNKALKQIAVALTKGEELPEPLSDAEEQARKLYEDAKKRGDLASDSWSQNPSTRVTEVRTHVDADGRIVVDSAIAIKAPGKDEEEDTRRYFVGGRSEADLAIDAALLGLEHVSGSTISETVEINRLVSYYKARRIPHIILVLDESEKPDGTSFVHEPARGEAIIVGGMAVYHRIDLPGRNLDEVIARLAADNLTLHKIAIARGESTDGVWLAMVSPALAARIRLSFEGWPSDLYAVNPDGARIIEEDGFAIVADEEEPQEEPPRPWNDRAAEIETMTEDARKELLAEIKGKDFYFCGYYQGAVGGTIVYIQPRTYFDKTETLWPQPLDIAALLPADLKEIEPGIYHSSARDYNTIQYDLSRRGFTENLYMQLHINNL